jgi:hypothetical protein
MAFDYVMTGDQDAAALSAEAVREMMKFGRWDYFLEAGVHVVGIQRASSTLIAVCLVADWLGDFVDSDERSRWLETAAEKGCAACYLSLFGMRYPEEVVGWTRDESSTYFEHRPGDRADLSRRHIILDSTNLKAVPAAALAIGAIATKDVVDPVETEKWLEMATFSLRSFQRFFEPDGSYHEGVSYANYTATQLVLATNVLRRFGRTDLSDIINWPGYAEYCASMTMATVEDRFEIINFGDNGNPKSGRRGHLFRTAVPFWIAGQFYDRRAQWVGRQAVGEHDLWSIIWYDPTIEVDPPPLGPSLWHSDLDWIVGRTGFQADDFVVAMRSGGPGNHEHADRNSIVLKCFGEQLVADPYRPPYSFNDPAWMMRTTAGHSALLIDGHGHQYHDGREGTNASEAKASIVRRGRRGRHAFWSSDATPAYRLVNPDVRSVVRSLIMHFDERFAIVVDRVVKGSVESSIQTRYFGYNLDGMCSLVATPAGFVIRRPNASLNAACYSPAGVETTVQQLPIPEETAKQHPFLQVSTRSASRDVFLVTVLVPAAGAAVARTATILPEEHGCVVTVWSADGSPVRVRVNNDGRIPEFAIV